MDAILYYIYIYKSFFEIRIYKYNFIIAKGFGDIPLWLQKCWYHIQLDKKLLFKTMLFIYIHLGMSKIEIALELFYSIFFLGWQPLEKGVLKFEIALGFLKFFFCGWQPLGKGILRVEIALELFLFFWVGWQLLEKGVWRFEIALGSFFISFGGNPWKRESGDLRLLWDYFFISFFWAATLGKKGSWNLRLLGFF